MSYRIITGDALERLRELSDESVHCVVTSPPYWGLRDYRGESTCCGCRSKRRRRKVKAVNGAFYLGSSLHRDADGTGPRLIHGAKPTPGGTLLTPEVVEHMHRHGVTRIERVEVEP